MLRLFIVSKFTTNTLTVFDIIFCFNQVIMATNRIETLDPALIRPGRIDRKIEFPLPDEKTKRRIFTIHTSRMTLADDVNLSELIMAKDDLSGADIKVFFSYECLFSGKMSDFTFSVVYRPSAQKLDLWLCENVG